MRRAGVALAAVIAVCVGHQALAQQSGWGRFSLFLDAWQQHQNSGLSTNLNEFIGNLSMRSSEAASDGVEYAVEARAATAPGAANNPDSVSIYDAWVGTWINEGKVGVRVGQMWLTELGGLGSLGGGLFQIRGPAEPGTGRYRFALFGGLEPQLFEAGYVPNVKKAGGFVAYDGANGRQHVLGYVTIRNGGLTERSVLTTYNFIPGGLKFFVYQTAEYDLQGPGGLGHGGLSYFFTTVRYAPSSVFDIQAMYHHGVSVDTRTITNDELAGRPVDSRALDGFLFESSSVRLTTQLGRTTRVWVGYGEDRNNLDDRRNPRTYLGFFAGNVVGSGLDFTATDSKIDASSGGYHSTYVSLGRSLGSRIYVSADYTSSLSVFRYTSSDGVTVETRPKSKRVAVQTMINATRTFSFLINAERLIEEDSHETRLLTGLVIRF
ncbi:MAG: hypothetical protein ACHQQS_09875 [Thermoanaerobaculales bacterium]